MENIFTNKKCQSHTLDVAALQLIQQNTFDEMILCNECLNEKKFAQNNIVIIEKIPEMIKEMKHKQNQSKQEQQNQNQSYLLKLNTSIVNYKFSIEELLNKMLAQVKQQLDKIQQQIEENSNAQQFDIITKNDIFNLCRYLNDQDISDKQQFNQVQQFKNQIKEQSLKFNSNEQYQQLQIALQSKPQQIQRIQPHNKIVIQEQQENKNILANQKINWRFSQLYKHHNIVLSNDGKTVKLKDFSFSGCLCDQAIPLNGEVAIEFKINKKKSILAGVCQKEQMNKNYEIRTHSQAKEAINWCYLMYKDGHTYFHEQNYQQHNFKFNRKDIIRIEVNQELRKITWINKSQKYPSISRDIPMAEDLYFCFRMYGDTKIELF